MRRDRRTGRRRANVPSVIALFIVVFAGPSASAETWISLCEGPAEIGPALQRSYGDASGRERSLRVQRSAPPAPSCVGTAIDVESGKIIDIHLLDAPTAGRLEHGIVLTGPLQHGKIEVSEIEPLPTTERVVAGAAPLFDNLLAGLEDTAFGSEGVAVIRREPERLELTCRPAQAPAGVTLHAAAQHLPRLTGLSLMLDVGGSPAFTFGLSDEERHRSGSPLMLGRLDGRTPLALAVPDGRLARLSPLRLTLLCPPDGGTLALRGVSLAAAARRSAATAPARAAWAWEPDWWRSRSAQLLRSLRDTMATTVFITVPVAADGRVENAAVLGSFIAAAAGQSIRVYAVEGDPRAILPAERAKFVARARAFAAFNRASPPERRLSGVQYDIEPYLVPGLNSDGMGWQAAYAATLAELRAAVGMTMEAAVPHWWSHTAPGLADRVAGHVDGLTIMNYRTDARQIERAAEPWLAWAQSHGKSVRIALEAGPLPNEVRRTYHRASAGELWVVPLGSAFAAIMIAAPAANRQGPSFRLVQETLVPAGTVTFRDDPARLFRMLPELERRFAPWPGFSGIALHGLL